MKTLVLIKMGCNFADNDKEVLNSDIGNYRVVSKERVVAKNGRAYIMDFTLHNKYKYRTLSKRGNKVLMHPVKELVSHIALGINTEYTDSEGMSFRDLAIESPVYNGEYRYTKHDILKVVNSISAEKYDSIEIRDYEPTCW